MALSDDDLSKPKRVKTPNLEVEQFDIRDRLELDRALAANAGVKKKYRGLRYSKILLPGQIGNESSE